MATIFKKWTKTKTDCYLLEITTHILAKKVYVTFKGHVSTPTMAT
jgi:6-phosphogluconate dehydrogenase